MTNTASRSGLELRTRISSDGALDLWLEEVPVSEPGPDEVVIRIEAAPLNPSDIILLLGPADLSTMKAGGTSTRPTLTASVPVSALAGLAARLDQALPAGNEGAGVVVSAGANARHLLGRTVAARSPLGMYAEYRTVAASACMALPAGTTAEQGASAFINPLTALGMVETMRREGHTALVHTAAASNLGQMLNRLCMADGIPLVNIVRSQAQAGMLRDMGAKHVLVSTSPTFNEELVAALGETGATLAFDAIGGGTMAETILAAMEAVAIGKAGSYSRYGSPIHKQVYIYGVLDAGPTQINRKFGMAWGIGGWLMTWFVEKIGVDAARKLRDRIAAELTTTFASRYSARITLAEALSPDTIRAYSRRATGEKFLLVPGKRSAGRGISADHAAE
ncbi:NADH oxidase [Burkholderia sp. WAC0059]|uniref:zinc-binding dehydrogenase n=1 Tax=Burkholderia sp. WAC0059 TaxID=2066022 RepID=UPI000C7F5C6D|nr:zinc-binding dehydrogenase [Burkholderia sp. WAC0059]PLZ03184.1 NADH oxidase [Burkholderia sp. WAC0059]